MTASVPAHAPRAATASPHLSFIHGLRGIAAMLVVFFHLYDSTPVAHKVASVIPALIDGLLRLGFLGVDLFFVISGYVIALTLYGRMATPRDGLRFFLRRQIRLDPPYWAAIAASIVSALLLQYLRPAAGAPVPEVAAVIAHLFYLQDFLGYKQIVGVFWTLCLEVQFYLLMVASVLLMVRLKLSHRALVWGLLPLYFLSLAGFWGLVELPSALFINRWFAFFSGVVLFFFARKQVGLGELLAVLLAPLAMLLVSPQTDNDIAAVTQVTVLLISLLFLLADRLQAMPRWLSGRVVSYLGTISYSLYLMHAVVGIRAVKLLVNDGTSIGLTWLLYAAGILISILSADLLYRLIEKPSQRLSQRLRWGQRPSA